MTLQARAWLGTVLAIGLMACAPTARASIIQVTVTLDPVNLDEPGTIPGTVAIGTFTWATPAYGTLIGGTVDGQWGVDFFNPTSAPGTYSIGGITVQSCAATDLCATNDLPTAWTTYTLTASDVQSLSGASSAAFTANQTATGNVILGTTTLTLDFAIPEPATVALFGTGLLGLALLARRARA